MLLKAAAGQDNDRYNGGDDTAGAEQDLAPVQEKTEAQMGLMVKIITAASQEGRDQDLTWES